MPADTGGCFGAKVFILIFIAKEGSRCFLFKGLITPHPNPPQRGGNYFTRLPLWGGVEGGWFETPSLTLPGGEGIQ